MISYTSIGASAAKAAARTLATLVAVAAIASCGDSTAPRPAGPSVTILAPADSVFEGDVVQLTAKVLDEAGREVAGAPVTWDVSDTTLAKVAGPGGFALLKPGTVRVTARSGTSVGKYDLAIGRLVAKSVELTPGTLSLGRGDRVQVGATVRGQGGRAITNRSVLFSSDDQQVAVIGSPDNAISSPGFLIATGPGSTTIRATIDGVTGTAHVGVVVADTTFSLTQFNGSPIPVLIAADSVRIDGVPAFAEVFAESGTFVLSGLAQLRYTLDVRFVQYLVNRETGERLQQSFVQHEFDRGVVTVGTNGSLSMLSEFIGPHLEHSAALQSDGYLVHFQIPGDNSFLDLSYRRQTP